MARFKNAADAAAVLAGDPQVRQQVENENISSRVVSTLIQIRVEKGITQEQVAQKMRCDPSKISRLESGNDFSLRWADIIGYVSALGINLNMTFDDANLPAAERIKHCVFTIHANLESLASLAKQVGADDEIAQSIHRFYGEVLMNFLVRFQASRDKLPTVNVTPQSILSTQSVTSVSQGGPAELKDCEYPGKEPKEPLPA
jgi:transcriptional regulator with XRE-family HTH domain